MNVEAHAHAHCRMANTINNINNYCNLVLFCGTTNLGLESRKLPATAGVEGCHLAHHLDGHHLARLGVDRSLNPGKKHRLWVHAVGGR